MTKTGASDGEVSSQDDEEERDEQVEEPSEDLFSKVDCCNANPELFDKLAFNVLSYLQSFEQVVDIKLDAGSGSSSLCKLWEGRNAPYVLPSDVKSFIYMMNGLSLRWRVDIGTGIVAVGDIKVNSVEGIKQIKLSDNFVVHSDGKGVEILPPDPKVSAAFSIADTDDGVVAMIFRSAPVIDTEPAYEIWYNDKLSSKWYYICNTFTQYVRLSILHLGIYGWHRVYSDEGLTMTTRQWMGLFCRERLCVYQHAFNSKRHVPSSF